MKTRITSPNFRKVKSDVRGKARKKRAAEVAKIEMQYQIVQLRRNGHTHKEIADALGIAPATVGIYLSDILTNTIIKYQESTEEARQMQLEQIDQLTKVYTPLATEVHNETRVDPRTKQEVVISVPPDPIYANLLINLMNRRAKLTALDMPETKKLEVTGMRVYEGVDTSKI